MAGILNPFTKRLYDWGRTKGMWLWRRATGRELRFRQEVDAPRTLYGTDYGGFYLCDNVLDENSIVYSCGIGKDASFDLELIACYGLQVFAFDPSPPAIEWLAQQEMPRQFHFEAYAISDFNGVAQLYPNWKPGNDNFSLKYREQTASGALEVPVWRLASLMESLGHTRLDVLKLDIESAEYDVIADLARSHLDIGQIVVEFHHDKYDDPLRTRRSIRQLRQRDYRIFYIEGREFGFIHSSVAVRLGRAF